MKKITFPLRIDMTGPEVVDLQAVLQQLIERRVILADNEGARHELSEALRRERTEQKFGGATRELVRIFQEERGLQGEEPGAVGETTANALNALLREWGLLEQPGAQVISGQVRRKDGLPFPGGLVRAFHETEQTSIRIGEDRTDTEGRYTIRYDMLPEVTRIHLRVSVSVEDGKPLHSSELIRDAKPLEIVNLVVPLTIRPAAQRRIEGRIVLEHGLPAANVNVRLYRHDFGSAEPTRLAETTTREDGLYALPYDVGGKAASLEVRAVDRDDNEERLSEILHDVSAEERAVINLVAPKTLHPLAAEYQRLTADLTPHVGDLKKLADARENAERQDLTVLNRATGWDARLIALGATAQKLSADTRILPDTLYALFRVGLPTDKDQLARVSVEAVDKALAKAREAGIVSMDDERVLKAKAGFEHFARETRLATKAAGALSNVGEMLAALPQLSDSEKSKFADILFTHRGEPAELWQKAKANDIAEETIKGLQLQGKLAYLTFNNAAVAAVLQQEIQERDNLAQLVEKDLYQADAWKARLTQMAGESEEALQQLIPPAYVGEKAADRLEAYAEDLARKVRLSFPTEVVSQMIKHGPERGGLSLGGQHEALKTPVRTFLQKAQRLGFELGRVPLNAFIKQNRDTLLGEIAPDQHNDTIESIKTLQRLYQITPTDEALKVLAKEGFTSANDIVAFPYEVFVERYGPLFPSLEEAQLVYRKAQQVSAVTSNVVVMAKQLASAPRLYAMSPPAMSPLETARDNAKQNLIKHYPTMEALFGSLDFCECEHCRSVLSPAAYLVDLLQFIEPDDLVWKKFLSDWKKNHNGVPYPFNNAPQASNFLANWKNKHDNAPYPFKNPTDWDNFLKDWREKYPGQPDPDPAMTLKPFDALIERRPDLPHVQLTCENINTVLPYIDPVNEILEYYVANGKLEEKAAHDTGEATTAELLAEPQNVIREAYDTLREASYPLSLPFDLWVETTRRFLDHFETPLWQVLETFRPTEELFAPAQRYDRAAIFTEYLGVSPAEYAIFIDPNPLPTWYELYGYESADKALKVDTDPDTDQRIDLNSAKALSRRLGISYKELIGIVQTGFVNPELDDLSVVWKLRLEVSDVVRYLKPEFAAQQKAFEARLLSLA